MAGIEICSRDRGFSRGERIRILNHAAAIYQNFIQEYARMGTLDVWYDHLDLEKTVSDTSDLFSQELKTLMNNAMKKAIARNSGRRIVEGKRAIQTAGSKTAISASCGMPVPVLSSRQAIPSCWKVRQNRMNMCRYKMESSVHRHGMRYSSMYILLCMAGHCSLVKAEMKES